MRLIPLVFVLGVAACGSDESSPTTPAPAVPPALDVPFGITDLEVGAGPEMEPGHLVAITYIGFEYDPSAAGRRGTELFSNGAAQFRIGSGELVPGVDMAVAGMRVGGKRQAVIPPDLAFGAVGTAEIPPNATLLLEIDLDAGEPAPFSMADIEVGTGAAAAAGSNLTVTYSGWLYDLLAEDQRGELFDSTSTADPFRFQLGTGAVIEGWDLGVVGMRAGGRRRLVIPHPLAYGAQSRGAIPPYATLLFEVELLEVQ